MRERIAQLLFSEKAWWIQAVGASIGMIIAAFFLSGGDDLYRYYLPFENGCLDCGYVPYYAQWFLWPLNLLPAYPMTWPVWTIVNIVGFLLLAYFTGINPFLLMISFPLLGQIWLGQVDILICLGIVMFLFAKNPYARGLGIILMLIKPQLTALSVIYSLLLEDRRSLGKLLLIPFLILLASFFVYGLAWPIDWITNALKDLPIHVWRLASLDIWRFGIILVPLPLFIKHQRKRLEAGLLVSALATPFFGAYSYVVFLLLDIKWWALGLGYFWVVGYPWLKETAMRTIWILPLIMLAVLLRDVWRERQDSKALVGKDV